MNKAERSRSILLASVAGSVGRHEKLVDSDAARAVELCLQRMERAVESCGGRVLASVRGELAALFADPDAACAGAREIQQGLADLPSQSGERFVARVGIAHGVFGEAQGRLSGEVVRVAAQLAGLAEPGQVLLSAAAQGLLSAAWLSVTRELGLRQVAGPLAAMPVFACGGADSDAARRPFVLRYGDQELRLDDGRQAVSIGRDAPCDIRIHDRRASRQHARIERRGEQVFLVDHSSNGSYVSLPGQAERFVRGDQCLLCGQGVISFAAPAMSAGADCAQFDAGQ